MSNGDFHGLLSDERAEACFQDSKPPYDKGHALAEANRCLYCHDAPCIKACPTEINIPEFIRKIGTDNVIGSARTIFDSNMLGYSCARVCPVSELCVGACVYNDWKQPPIEIGKLQRYATESALAWEKATGKKLYTPKPKIGKKVAMIGSGPASMSCAAVLALEGVDVTIYEKRGLPGGLNTTGVAPYKMPANDSLNEVQWILDFGVNLSCGVEIGKDKSMAQLLEEYDAVFLGAGLGADNLLGLDGEEAAGVFGATVLIERIKNAADFKVPESVKTALVVGGGNTAIDIARELAMLNIPEVAMVYRRSEKEMSGYDFEMNEARLHGVRLHENCKPKAVLHNEQGVTGLRVDCQGEERDIAADWVVYAIGQDKAMAAKIAGVETNEKGWVVVDENYQTSKARVYAGGDCINGGKEVVNAAAHGRDAARAMLKSWSG